MLSKYSVVLTDTPFYLQQSAIMPLLHIAQRQNGGWIPLAGVLHLKCRERSPLCRSNMCSNMIDFSLFFSNAEDRRNL